MENKNTSIWYNGLVWGAILGFIGIIYAVILYMLDQNLNQNLGYLGMVITIVILILGVRSYRDNIMGGILPFSPAFKFGFVVVVVSTVINLIYSYILWTVIDPGIIGKMKDMQMEKMLEQGISEEALDQAMAISGKFMTPLIMTIMALFFGILIGTIIALIVAAIFKKNEPEDLAVAE